MPDSPYPTQWVDATDLRSRLIFVRAQLRKIWAVTFILAVLPSVITVVVADSNSMAGHIATGVVCLVYIAIMCVFLPSQWLVTPVVPRIAAGLCGISSVGLALVTRMQWGSDSAGIWHSVRVWLGVMPAVCVVLLFASFLFEMLRRHRTQVITSISVIITSAVAAWCCGGWVFLPDLLNGGTDKMLSSLVVLMVVSLVFSTTFPWGRLRHIIARALVNNDIATDDDNDDEDQELPVNPDNRRAMYSLGVLPVVITGVVIPLLIIATLVVW